VVTRLTEKDRNDAGSGDSLFDSTVSSLASFGKGLGQGVKQDPFVALALKELSEIPGVDPDGFRQVVEYADNSTSAQVGRFIGEFGPTLLFGIPLAGVGAVGGRLAIRGIAKQLATKAALQDIKTAAGRGALTRSAASGAAGKTATAESTFLKGKLGQVQRKAGDTNEALLAGRKPSIQGNPVLQRSSESAGANLAFSSLTVAQEKARGKSDVEALKTGGLVLAFGAGIDVALVGGARLLFPGARTVDLDSIRSRYIRSNAPEKLNAISRVRKGRIQEINEAVTAELNTEAQVLDLTVSRASAGKAIDIPVVGQTLGENATNAQRLRQILKGEGPGGALAAKRVKELLAEKRGLKTIIKSTDEAIAAEGTQPYIGRGVGYFTPVQDFWDKVDPSGSFRVKWTSAAESLFGKAGSVGNRIGTQLVRAVTHMEQLGKTAEVNYSLWSDATRKAMGASQREWKNGIGKNLNSAHAWETGGEAGLRRYMKEEIGRSSDDIETAVAAFKARKEFEWDLYQVQGRKIGGKDAIDMESVGLKEYLTHSSLDLPEDDLVKLLVKNKGMTKAEAMEVIRANKSHLDPVPAEGVASGSPARTGPLDFDRFGKGSTRDKILNDTIPMNPNVWDSGLRTAQAAQRRIALHPILGDFTAGERGRVFGGTIDELVKAVEAESGMVTANKFRTLLESIAGRTYYNESMRKIAVATTSIQVATKLPMAVLANASQAILTTTWTGIRASLKGAIAITNKANREHYAQALAVHEHIIRGIGRSVDSEGLALTSFEKAADWVLRFSGFSRVERFNRIHAAAASQVAIRDKLVRAAAGRLRGNTLDSSRKMLGELGLDLGSLARDLNRMGDEAFFSSARYLRLETDAVIRGAQKTQFFPGRLRTPSAWSSPVGRVLFQFKTFSTGQSRFFRDAVLNEWSAGNVVPMATLLSFSPIAGELVADGRAIIKDKNRGENGIARYIDNATAIGGLGLWTDAMGQIRYGNLAGFILGPTFSDLNQVGEALLSPQGGSIWDIIKRQPLYQTTNFLMGAAAETGSTADEYLDALGAGDDGAVTRVDVGERLTERIRSKR
jgi:hypothetical protein